MNKSQGSVASRDELKEKIWEFSAKSKPSNNDVEILLSSVDEYCNGELNALEAVKDYPMYTQGSVALDDIFNE